MERRAWVRAMAWLAIGTAAVRTLPYASLRTLLSGLAARRTWNGVMSLDDYARAVARAARVVPGTTCLSQAFAAACMLKRDGCPSVLSIGVNLHDGRALEAHAWLDVSGMRITGGRSDGLHVIVRDDIVVQP